MPIFLRNKTYTIWLCLNLLRFPSMNAIIFLLVVIHFVLFVSLGSRSVCELGVDMNLLFFIFLKYYQYLMCNGVHKIMN